MKMSCRNRVEYPKYHQLISKKGAKSNIWQFYGIPADESGKTVTENISICKLCKQPVSSKGGTTSNLRSHLKNHHTRQFQSLISSCSLQQNADLHDAAISSEDDIDDDQTAHPLLESQPSTSQDHNIAKKTQIISQQNRKNVQKTLMDYAPLDDKSAKRCTNSITKFLATSMQPYSLVEEESFKEMVNTLNHRYCLPSRKFFSHTAIPKLYAQAVEKLKEILPKGNSADNNFSITCDCWTSTAGHPYLALTVHFINLNWEFISACLSCTLFQENHTAENVREAIRSKLIEWDLNPNCVVSCTTDNGANIVNSIKLLSISRVPCFAHCINIGVNRAIEVPQIKKAVGRLKSLQNAVAHSWKMQRDLRAAQELLQCDVKSLPSACPTRWWSTLKLCKRFLENQLPLCKMFQNFADKKHLMPEGSEITALENFVQVTSILQDVTENLTGENYVTSSAVLPLIRQIKKKLKIEETDTFLLKVLKEKVLSSLQQYESEPLNTLLSKSTFVDPRFRLQFFDDDAKEGVKESIIHDLKDKFDSSESSSDIFDKSKKKQRFICTI